MMSQSRTDLPRCHLLFGEGGESIDQCCTLRNPRLLPTEQLGDSRNRQSILFDHGPNDAAFVERSEHTTWRVGQQKQALMLRSSPGRFNNDGNLLFALTDPGGKTLESVDDVEIPLI
ncbi:MAG: hypothetical protein ACOYM3_19545 [Terrimicrobiaceae bacterium]